MQRITSTMLGWIFFLQIISPAVYAETLNLQAPDIEAPVIKFDVGDTEITEGIKTISVEVTDNRGVASVTLYYRNAEDIGFVPRAMKKTGTNTYSTEITVDPVISKRLEFYLRADDISGNSVFEGQKFSPFAYTILPALEGGQVDAAAPDDGDEGMSTMTLILIGLGVAALAGGGGGGGGGSPAPSTGTVTITTELPD